MPLLLFFIAIIGSLLAIFHFSIQCENIKIQHQSCFRASGLVCFTMSAIHMNGLVASAIMKIKSTIPTYHGLTDATKTS